MFRGTLQDVIYATRQLRRRPVFALAAVLTLALGVAVNTSVFAIASAVVGSLTPGARYDQVLVLKLTEPRRQLTTFHSMGLPAVRRARA